jgi:hypothetical protein
MTTTVGKSGPSQHDVFAWLFQHLDSSNPRVAVSNWVAGVRDELFIDLSSGKQVSHYFGDTALLLEPFREVPIPDQQV